MQTYIVEYYDKDEDRIDRVCRPAKNKAQAVADTVDDGEAIIHATAYTLTEWRARAKMRAIPRVAYADRGHVTRTANALIDEHLGKRS